MLPKSVSWVVIALTIMLSWAGDAAAADNQTFLNCSSTIQCGTLSDIGYPFWGLNRASYCGISQFELTCPDNSTAFISLSGFTYRVLQVNNISHVMTVARSDYWKTLCPSTLPSAAQEIPSPFTYTTDTSNLTLYYGCTAASQVLSSLPATSEFNCTISGTTLNTSYYVTKNVSDSLGSTTLGTLFGECKTNVTLAANQSAVQAIESSPSQQAVQNAIDQGFGLQWSDAILSECQYCISSGGQCGRDTSTNDFACYCRDKAYPSACPGGGSNSTTLSVALPLVGAALTGLLVGFWIFWCRQRKARKKKAAAELQTRVLGQTPASSKGGLPASTPSYSRATPSYPTSKSDLEKGSMYFGAQLFSYQELEEATDNFDPSKELGDGGFGTVYYGKLQDQREVAVKRLYENNLKRVEQFMNEVEILTRLRHPNLVTLHGCTSRRSRELLLVYEYIPNGTIADHLHGKRAVAGAIPWNVRLSIAIESADALAYLHESDVIHRDVKTNNILLDNEFRVKVADFGLSRLFPNDVTHVSTAPQGTPGYVDPEYYQCYQLTDKSDVYSFGVVLCELISSKPAVDTNRHRHDINLASMAISKIQNHALHELVDPSLGYETDYSVRRMATNVAELAFRCLQHERDMRPTMKEVLEALRKIQREEEVVSIEDAEVVDIPSEEIGPLRHLHPPLSPDSSTPDKWNSSGSFPPHSF